MSSPFRRMRHRHLGLVCVLALAAPLISLGAGAPAHTAAAFPNRLTDTQFWQLVSGFSENEGSFQSDNYVSNEEKFQDVIPTLARPTPRSGGAYLGVGPDQNFTYIIALRPQVAFIVDIRRQNLLQHLLFKALVELSGDRAEFLSLLFSRPRPPDLAGNATVNRLITAYAAATPSETLYVRNLTAVVKCLTRAHHFALTTDDLIGLNHVYRAFFRDGPDIQYFVARAPYLRFPTYGEMVQTTDAAGAAHGYLTTEQHFRRLKDFHERNLIVPMVGDFAGEKALRAVASYLKEHELHVTAFYVSNVEAYLFSESPNWRRFYANLAALPADERSVLIRSYDAVRQPTRIQLATVLDSLEDLVRAVQEGTVNRYVDVLRRSR